MDVLWIGHVQFSQANVHHGLILVHSALRLHAEPCCSPLPRPPLATENFAHVRFQGFGRTSLTLFIDDSRVVSEEHYPLEVTIFSCCAGMHYDLGPNFTRMIYVRISICIYSPINEYAWVYIYIGLHMQVCSCHNSLQVNENGYFTMINSSSLVVCMQCRTVHTCCRYRYQFYHIFYTSSVDILCI